ncbi:MAG: hypothetical protein ACLUE2_14160 [Bacteroides cellulosilyticus]
MIDEEECMAELNQLIGLSSVKREVKEIADYIKVERAKAEAMGKKFQGVVDHYLFVGNPGTERLLWHVSWEIFSIHWVYCPAIVCWK